MKSLVDCLNEALAKVENLGELKQWLTDNNYKFENIESGWHGGKGSSIAVEGKTKGVQVIFDFLGGYDECVEFAYVIKKNGETLWDEDRSREINRLPHDLIDYVDPREFMKNVIAVRKKRLKKVERDYHKRVMASPDGITGDYDLQVAKRSLERAEKILAQL